MSIRLEVLEDGTLVAIGTDGETTTRAVCATTDHEVGMIAVPGPLLNDLIRDLPAGDVKLAVVDSTLSVTATSGTYRIPVLAETPPPAPELGEITFSTSGPAFAAAVGSLQPLARGAEGIFATVKMESNGSKLRLVSTDRFRLGLAEIEVTAGDAWELSAQVPIKALAEVARLFGKAETVRIAVSATGFGATDDQTTMITRLVGGQWPKYQPLLDKERIGTARVDADALIASTKRVSRFAGTSGAPASVKLRFEDGQLTVSAGGTGDATESVAYDGAIEALELFVNAQYFIEAIDGAAAQTVVVSPTGPSSALFIDGVYQHLVMPTRG